MWYPAVGSAEDLRAQVPTELRPTYEIDAHPGAEAADDGPYPVVLFSHGFGGYPEQSADPTTHQASWGFVVVAPDHVERSLSGLLGTAGADVRLGRTTRVLSAAWSRRPGWTSRTTCCASPRMAAGRRR